MSKDPAVLFYTSDFLTGVTFMSMAQRGKYITLLCLQHQKGHLTEKEIIKVCGAKDADIFSKFIQDDEMLFYNERMEKEIIKRDAHCLKQKQNVMKRWNNDGNTTVLPLENENEDINIDKEKREGLGEKKEHDHYLEIFNYYLTLGLIKHTKLTREIRSAIDTAQRRCGYSWDELKTFLERHAYVVKLTAGQGQFAVEKRGLIEFFGQKVKDGVELICSEYSDDGAKWLRYKDGLPKSRAAPKYERGGNERPIENCDYLAIDPFADESG